MDTDTEGDGTSEEGINAYATLLTRPSYLAGAVLLAYSLHKHTPGTPLIILYTPETLPEHSIAALKAEAKYSNVILHPVEHLRLPKSNNGREKHGNDGMVAERFIDTWTKLRVFEVLSTSLKDGNQANLSALCFLDADMLILSDPTPLIFGPENTAYLHEDDGRRLCATHVCVCNLDGDAWAPPSWTKQNCAFTHVTSPTLIAPVKSEPETMAMFNSGTFVFRPSTALRSFALSTFENTPVDKLRSMKFPDQDFLNAVFAGKWKSLSWRTNALKTWRYWHPNIWTDDLVAVLHYIVDKPWAARVQADPVSGALKAGYKGKDGETHAWWWAEFERWQQERKENGEEELLENVERYVASEEGEQSSEDMRAVGGGAQDFARRWEKGEQSGQSGHIENNGAQDNGAQDNNKANVEDGSVGDCPQGPILRKPMLGERGHGPVVRGGANRGLGRGGPGTGLLSGRGQGRSYMET